MNMLIIEVFNVNRGNKDYIRIAAQPLRGDALHGGMDNTFCASNGFFLYSSGTPCVRDDGLYVRGCHSQNDNIVMEVPNRKWLDKLALCVREYNTYLEETGGENAGLASLRPERKKPSESYKQALFNTVEVIR